MEGGVISLILPYWDRQQAADAALAKLSEHYAGLPLEVIVVDDGNAVPFVVPNTFLNVRVVALPRKDVPKSCVVPWNEGVKAATGDIIAISCIEVLHDQPILAQLVDAVREKVCVLAAAYCPEEQRWHCHSTVRVPDCQPGTGLPFLAVMRREDFVPFDEALRDGAGYEDRDWIRAMVKAGNRFLIRDDLPVTHPKTGARTPWPAGYFERNVAIYKAKWNKPVTLVCLKQGTAFGPEYVNNLFDMVRRNLTNGTPGRFVCITDDPIGLADGIETMPLPLDLERWWGKLYLFKRDLFADGERMAFMDLDTLIVGNLDEILSYDGQFATLHDFYQPQRLGPAIMLWEAGAYAAVIWEEWERQGRPRDPLGDLWWLNRLEGGAFAKRADRLQALYPGAFCSFKAHCNPLPPKGTRVVCFHGQPRPHNCDVQWVKDVWRIGGGGMAEFEIVANTEQSRVEANVKANVATGFPWLEIKAEHSGHAVIVGGGPSLKASLDEIRWRQEHGQVVIALNGSAHFLRRNGILADWQVILDSRPENAAFVHEDVPQHFVCSQCDPAVLAKIKRPPIIFHVNTPTTVNTLPDARVAHLISTGSTVGLIAMGIAYTQGFRNIHLHGMDSSYAEGSHHAYAQALNDSDRVVEAIVGDRVFNCAPWMVAQVNQFQEVAVQLAELGCTITVAGDGLLPHVAHLMSQPQMEAA